MVSSLHPYHLIMLIKNLLYASLILSTQAPPNALANPIGRPEVIIEIQKHRGNVLQLGLHVVEDMSAEFPELSRLPKEVRIAIVHYYLSLHDAPKLWNKPKLQSYGYTLPVIPLTHIQKNWGKHLPESERGWVHEMNAVEDRYKLERLELVYQRFGVRLSPKQVSELEMLETLVDIYDLKQNRTAEVSGQGAKRRPFAASNFFRQRKKYQLARLARLLELQQQGKMNLCGNLF